MAVVKSEFAARVYVSNVCRANAEWWEGIVGWPTLEREERLTG